LIPQSHIVREISDVIVRMAQVNGNVTRQRATLLRANWIAGSS